ncbi:MAG: tetratricopeptide repeat protein, partial [Alphaproteobacteria bacterium]|nr:tetratricopeptide repeat protein [Alphaproteobacteria bacterium]
YNAEDFESAERKVRSALMVSPTHGDALYLLGLIAYKKGIWTEAIDVLSLVTRIYPQYPNYRLALAEVYQAHGDMDKAKELYLTEPNNAKAMAAIGWIELKKGNLKEAKQIFLHNRVATSFYGLAEMNKGKKKLDYLKQAFELEKSPEIAKALILYYIEKKKYTTAKKYMKYVAKDKFIQALFLKAEHKELKAIQLLKELTISNQFLWQAWLELAKTAEIVNDTNLAEMAYRHVLNLKNDSLEALQGLARTLMKANRLNEAIDFYQRLARENPQNSEMLVALAVILEGLNETSEALGLYFNALILGRKGLSKNIEQQINKLAQTDKETALRFAKGWVKNFPKNKVAQKVLKGLKVLLFIICFWGCNSFAQIPVPDKDLNLLWQAKIAEYGDPLGQYELAKIYETGKDVPKDLQKAIHYYQLSAAQNYLPSAMELARIFENEMSVKDEKKSIEWYTFAANRGEMQAENYLFHYYDELPQPNKEEALYWLEKMLKSAFPEETDLTRISADYERLRREVQ